jgi:hypothetical protein
MEQEDLLGIVLIRRNEQLQISVPIFRPVSRRTLSPEFQIEFSNLYFYILEMTD